MSLSSYTTRNLLALLATLVVTILLYVSMSGYRWVVDDLAVENVIYIGRFPDLSIEKKWRVKNGIDFRYLNFIKEHTGENAVIWMPDNADVQPPGRQSPFKTGPVGIKNKAWSYYYLYPRKLIYDKAEAGPRGIDYVAIVNGRGYEHLSYKMDKKAKHTILPYKK